MESIEELRYKLNSTHNSEKEAVYTEHQLKIEEMEKKMVERYEKYTDVYAKWETGHMANQILSKQLDDLVAANKRLENNLNISLTKNHIYNPPQNEEQTKPEELPNEEMERVTILHDSLCKMINNTILSREGIKTKKVWAPDIDKMLVLSTMPCADPPL